ncbi:hypothetical protein Fcan01_06638 [Folsomia candida]|uniref:Odorant receptor n=2 Tax=Folsomia candida TaxID=158441 RepID=A0A226EIZ2_FOLCA|nr:hypothetical protein Fcan01_06638 [Folsomia candida]
MDLLSGKMFTPNAVSTLRRFIGWRQITQSIICEWDDGNSSLKLIRKQTKILRFSFGVLLGSIYSIYLVLRLVTLLSSSSHFSIVDVLWTFLWGLYYLWAVGNYINTVLKQKDAVFFFMGMIHLDRHFEDTILSTKISVKSKPKWRNITILEVLMLVEDFMVVSFAACGSIMGLALSHKPAFISSLLDPQYHSFPFLVGFALFEFYTIATTSGSITFFCNYLATYMAVTFHWVNMLRRAFLLGGMRDTRALRNYWKLQLLNAYFNHAHTTFVYPMTMFLYFSTSILTFFGSVRLKETTPIVEYILFPMACSFLLIVFTALLYGSGSVYSSSCEFLHRFANCPAVVMNNGKSKLGNRLMNKQIKALKPFGVQIGTFPYITKPSVLMVYAVWSNYAISLLIAVSNT